MWKYLCLFVFTSSLFKSVEYTDLIYWDSNIWVWILLWFLQIWVNQQNFHVILYLVLLQVFSIFLYSIYNTGCKQIILCWIISLLSINIILSLQLILMLFNMINCHHNFINHFGQRCVKHFSESNLYLLWNGKMSHTFTTIDSRQDKFILFMLFFCRLIIVWMLQVKSCCITLSCFITVLLYNKSDSMQIIKPWNFLTSRLLYAFLARFFFISCFCFYWM